MIGKVAAHVEGADTDHHGAQALELLGREVGAVQASHLAPHLLQGLGDAVACAGDVANSLRLHCQIQRDGLQLGLGLKHLRRDMFMAKHDVMTGPRPSTMVGPRRDFAGRGFSRCRDHERQPGAIALA